ncbi:hypothetical protein [Wenxinia marina]|uniref:Uncharacterized protein n=1 Tax=Wenxinia marina DSM 24838 TaxID=1123501 RepID=A0A0D0NP66_9RHOB|nr:hypothetical protein [Wenxinia marina]KIQ70100.1 hypothetical protein Wenmar_01672 [Wenxinia marina DSM 24838]GGL63468.1 hypothetical protein GCM10011392_17710 [Wenxinia marina]
MHRFLLAASVLAILSGCGDGQPFFDDEEPAEPTEPTDPTDPETPNDILDTGTVLPPGATEPEPDGGLTRSEAGGDTGGGYVDSVAYQPGSDTFVVDGLGFDGANVYQRGTEVGSLGGYAVFEADVQAEDTLTGEPIGQIVPYRALYGVSDNQVDGEARTAFAIVRTGGYVNYGFGGFVYERNGAVVLPDSGQAVFSGDYAGMRVFDARGGLEFTRADMQVAIDFDDFNTNDAVQGRIFNRVAFDEVGGTVPLGGEDQLVLPDVLFNIEAGGGGGLTEAGEISGTLSSNVLSETGALETYEEGTYYGILAGDTTAGDGGELVGIVVLESDDPRYDGVTAQETGGFILYRGATN